MSKPLLSIIIIVINCLIGGGRNYISLPTGKSPTRTPSVDENFENSTPVSEANEPQPQPRPQLKVMIPGQKGFIPKTVSVISHVSVVMKIYLYRLLPHHLQ